MDCKFLFPGRAGPASLALAMLWVGAGAVAQPQGPLERVDSWLATIRTLEADFEQELLDDDGRVLSQSSGTMVLKRPGNFRWHYQTPSELLVLSDGEQIFSYDVELENVTIMTQSETLRGSPAALLAGSAAVSEGFELRGAWTAEDIEWIELAPTDGNRDFRVVRLGFAQQTLASMELYDQLGQTTRIVFSDIDSNEPVADDLFVFVVPEGVDVIHGAEMSP